MSNLASVVELDVPSSATVRFRRRHVGWRFTLLSEIRRGGVAMKPFVFAVCVVFGCVGLNAQKFVWQPTPGHTQVPIWPGAVPDARPVAGQEKVETAADPKDLVAGKPMACVSNVSQPTMTVYSPKGKNTGAAVVVFPGGGYRVSPSILKARRSATGSRPRGLRACC